LRILITNNSLAERAGTELYVRDLASALLARGHQPIAYSQVLGSVAEELRAAAVPVVDDLERISEPPDVIHGHHHLETMTALQWFPGVPALFVCHGWLPWQEAPPLHPRIRQWVAVDELCRQRLVDENGIRPDEVEVLLNFVDLDRFRPRPDLPPTPRRALVFSNRVGDGGLVEEIRDACSQSGVVLDVAGVDSGNPTSTPESLLQDYDLVFAKGRCALEAMAVGCAVVLCDGAGSGPMVDSTNFRKLRPLNFGVKALSRPVRSDVFAERIAEFDRHEAAAVRDRVRSEAGLSESVDRLLALYEKVVGAESCSPDDEGHAIARYLRGLAPRIKENDHLHLELANAAEETRGYRIGNENLSEAVAWHEGESRRIELTAAERITALESEVRSARGELERAYGTLTWRLRERLLGTRVGRALRGIVERFR
jgi:hypothetical protein